MWQDSTKNEPFKVAQDLLKLSIQCCNSVKDKNLTSSYLLDTVKVCFSLMSLLILLLEKPFKVACSTKK